jgi:hypothetical protein
MSRRKDYTRHDDACYVQIRTLEDLLRMETPFGLEQQRRRRKAKSIKRYDYTNLDVKVGSFNFSSMYGKILLSLAFSDK